MKNKKILPINLFCGISIDTDKAILPKNNLHDLHYSPRPEMPKPSKPSKK